jgi:ABC-type phosphate transport system permease subunit
MLHKGRRWGTSSFVDYPMAPGGSFFRRIKRSELEAHHQLPTSGEISNMWNFMSVTSVFSILIVPTLYSIGSEALKKVT